jgi:predicted nucleotidyltransferase
MHVTGIVAEFDPFHRGHAYLLSHVRKRWPDTAIVAVMSGYFTQRGAPAALRPCARAEMALHCGADLVLELPLPWAISSAEGFARGGVEVLRSAGADALAFGSECGDEALLRRCAKALSHPDFPDLLRQSLSSGVSYAAARQQAVSVLAGEDTAAVLESPNDALGVSYLCAAGEADWRPELLTVERTGASHNAAAPVEGIASASHIRDLLEQGAAEQAASLLPEPCRPILHREWEAGLCPASLERCQRAALYRLRTMTEADFLALPDCSEGLEHRLYRASREARSLEEFYQLTRSRRCTHARARRLALWAFLGLTAADRLQNLPCVRVLGLNSRGREVLRSMKGSSIPVLTKPAAARSLSPEGQHLISLEERAADLWRLCLPGLERSAAGSLLRESPVVL